MEGDLYKRTSHPDATDEQRNWLDRKSISFNHYDTDFDLLFSDRLAGTLIRDYKMLTQLYEFLCVAETRK